LLSSSAILSLISFFNYLKKEIKDNIALEESKLDDLCFNIYEKLSEQNISPNGEKFDTLISFKPTKESEPILDYIEQYSLMGRTLSEYFRSMFASYTSLPQDKREEIIFKPQYEAITKAIKDRKKVFITLSNGQSKIETAPYAIANSKEELHLYVIGVQKHCTPVRLSRIVSVRQLTAHAEFTAEQEYILKKMLKYGPQFLYTPYEKEALVELTERGIDKFKKIYIHRPVPYKVEGNKYYFECSHTQIKQYFVRFGEDAKVIYPKKLKEEVISFHRKALNHYSLPQNKNK
jgi:hypothetical protein